MAVVEAVEVAREAGLQAPLRQHYGHLCRSLRISGLLGGAVLLAVGLGGGRRGPAFGGFLFGRLLRLGLLLELLLDVGRDPTDVRLGGGRHARALEDVGSIWWPDAD